MANEAYPANLAQHLQWCHAPSSHLQIVSHHASATQCSYMQQCPLNSQQLHLDYLTSSIMLISGHWSSFKSWSLKIGNIRQGELGDKQARIQKSSKSVAALVDSSNSGG